MQHSHPYVLIGSRWPKRTLTWRIDRYSARRNKGQLTAQQQEETFRQAFQLWASVSNLEFVQLPPGRSTPDISILFVRRDHGDGYPFYGRGGTLAHAMDPQGGGDIHVDDDEDWTLDSYLVCVLCLYKLFVNFMYNGGRHYALYRFLSISNKF